MSEYILDRCFKYQDKCSQLLIKRQISPFLTPFLIFLIESAIFVSRMNKQLSNSNYLALQPHLQGAVIRLLLSRDEANLRLAVQLLSQAETPPLLRAALLVAAHQARRSDAQQLMLKQALRAKLPERLIPAYDKLFFLHHETDPYPGPNGLHVVSLTRLLSFDEELDGMETARIMLQSDDVRLRACALHYWLLSEDERQLYFMLSTLKAGDLQPDKQHKTVKLYARLNESIDAFKRRDVLVYDGSEMPLAQFPEVLLDFPYLTELSLTHHAFDYIPSEALVLPRLQKLTLSHNRLAGFPTFKKDLPYLHYLDLSHQQVSWQDYAKPLGSLSNLKSLKLAGNGLREVPESIAALPALVHLDLRDNDLRELPGWLFEMPRLQSVDLRGNGHVQVPEVGSKVRLLR
jgi:hypothetical protein